MTDTGKSAREELDRLAAELIEDIFQTSDEDILAEAREEYGDPEAVASAMRGLFEKVCAAKAKESLAAAKAAIAENRDRRTRVVSLNDADARTRLAQRVASEPSLTLAARKEEGWSDNDVKGILEDLEELDALAPRTDDEDKG